MKRRQFIGAGLAVAAGFPFRGFTAVAGKVPDLPARTLDGGELTLRGTDVESLAASLRGELLTQGDPEYDAVRRLWNASFDRKPALIARCSGAADVAQAVNFARAHSLLTAVRAGGHSFSGKSSCDGGLMIDLQPMVGVRVDPAARRAWLEAGSRLGHLDHETLPFGLATTTGTVSHTGAAGLTLGGGFGRLGRRFGLACDNVASFDVVTADGRFLRASEDENRDLYWGLRGGGGNFGVVTTIEYRLHPMNPIMYGGSILWPAAQAREVLRAYGDVVASAPEAVCVQCFLFWMPDGAGVVQLEVTWSGDHAEGEGWTAPLRRLGKPLQVGLGPMPYMQMQTSNDGINRAGRYYYAKNGFAAGLDDAGIERILESWRSRPGLYATLLDVTGGAYNRVPATATAFPTRDSQLWLGCWGNWDHAAESDDRIARMRAAWGDLEPLTDAFYANMEAPNTTAGELRGNYGVNFDRMVEVKTKYDPMNQFRLNANVPPRA
jgi:hypothetical protein